MKIRKSIYIESEDYKYLQMCADLNSRSENQFICMLLHEWIEADILRGKEGEINELYSQDS
jgi:hypothetical protein